MTTAELLKSLDQALQHMLRLTTFPLAVRMIAPGEALPERAKRPKADFGAQMAICQAFALARHTGRVIAMNGEDMSCPLAKAVWGFEPLLGYCLNGMTCAGMSTQTPAAGAVTEAGVDKWDYGQWAYVAAAPLNRCAFEPHLILIYGNSAQVMRLLIARLWQTGGRLTSSFCGRIDCADSVITTMKTDECQVILPCYGDRVFAQAEDGEMAFTIPYNKIQMILDGLAGTHAGGIRYPIPKFLNYTGQFPDSYVKMEELWAEGKNSVGQ
ncbi:MAG: DUF169 domain-containing protein [Anaerolineae bacterium]